MRTDNDLSIYLKKFMREAASEGVEAVYREKCNVTINRYKQKKIDRPQMCVDLLNHKQEFYEQYKIR